MHLKLDSSGSIDDGDVARDLGQEPADIVVLSAADSDLAAFGAAYATLAGRLSERAADQSAGARASGVGRSLCRAHAARGQDRGAPDARRRKLLAARRRKPAQPMRCAAGHCSRAYPARWSWNAALAARGTLGCDETHALWRYCSEGGVENAELALRFAAHLIGHGEAPPRARPMPSAGFWRGEPANDGAAQRHRDLLPRAGRGRRYRRQSMRCGRRF